MINDCLALPPPNAHFIWYCAWFSLPSALYAYIHPETYHLAWVPATVFTTSLLYWRNPILQSWRRTLDITTVLTGATYQTYYAFKYIHPIHPTPVVIYTSLFGISFACYGWSHYYMARGQIWRATYAHACIHLIANVANMVLYTSKNNITII